MDVSVGLAPGADENPLARWAHDTIRGRVFPAADARSDAADARRRRDLLAMRATVALVAPDRRVSATLRFDHGSVAVHDGMAGIPDVTICGKYDLLLGLASLPAAPWRTLASELVAGELEIYGLLGHPRLVLRVLRLLCQ